ncbi:MAG: heme-dependent peroxidase [Planctomycetaceae bacterium]|nr:heme-dependent peroxidase [Planctomycetaceae bacterium]
MQRPHAPQSLPDPTRLTTTGWHSLHVYYTVNAGELSALSPEERQQGAADVIAALDPNGPDAPLKMQCCAVSGHRADLGVIMFDPDPLKIDRIHQRIRASALGPALEATYSFVSLTEISEYVPTVEQYAERLQQEGTAPDDPAFQAKVNAYEQRLPMMNKQRIYPEMPEWPVVCFYPMNKSRVPGANWYLLPFSERSRLMAEHATSGIKFAGKVSQVITASTGMDDWEWGVTLWSRAPEYIKEIVYTMRFDQASAEYGEFGEFYVGYVMSAEEVLKHLLILN